MKNLINYQEDLQIKFKEKSAQKQEEEKKEDDPVKKNWKKRDQLVKMEKKAQMIWAETKVN